MAEAMDGEQPSCRICFAGSGADGSQPLVSPCACQGSQKYVHLSCLRQWQRSIQLDAPNHPQESKREERHRVCNVCRAPFDVAPQDRADMLSDLAGLRPEDIRPGMLLVTKTSAAESAARSSHLNFMIRAYIEMKAAHFREAVYILTETSGEEAADGSDPVLGVNLSRTLSPPDMSMLEGAPQESELEANRANGVEVQWMNGGPCQPKVVTSFVPVAHLPRARRADLCARHGAAELAGDDEAAVLWGPLRAVLACAVEEAEALRPRGGAVVVLAWAGLAQWSRVQLLGELARGSWGWGSASPGDITAAIAATRPGGQSLWESLRHSERIQWASDNELSRGHEQRTNLLVRRAARADEHEVEPPDQDAAAVEA